MIAIDKYMYHFHPHNGYDEYWEEGNVIEVDKKFNLSKQLFLKCFSTGVPCVNPNGIKPLSEIIDLLFKYVDSEEKLLELKELDEETYLKNMKQFITVLRDSKEIITYASIYNLESSMENVRREYYGYLPSRINSLFCVEESDVSLWADRYKKIDCDLYEVSLTGSLFETYREYVPPMGLTTYDTEMLSHAYWNPKYRNLEDAEYREFLFNGKAKVLRKVDKKEFE